MFVVILVPGYSTFETNGFITSIIAFSVATTDLPPNFSLAVEAAPVVAVTPVDAGVLAVVIVYESILILPIDVCVLLIWSNGIPCI